MHSCVIFLSAPFVDKTCYSLKSFICQNLRRRFYFHSFLWPTIIFVVLNGDFLTVYEWFWLNLQLFCCDFTVELLAEEFLLRWTDIIENHLKFFQFAGVIFSFFDELSRWILISINVVLYYLNRWAYQIKQSCSKSFGGFAS